MQNLSFGRDWTRTIHSNSVGLYFFLSGHILHSSIHDKLIFYLLEQQRYLVGEKGWEWFIITMKDFLGLLLPATPSADPQTPPKDKDEESRCHRALPLTLEGVKLWANTVMCWLCDLRCQPDVFSGPWWCTQLSQKKMKIEASNGKPTGNLFLSNYGCCSLITIAQGPAPSGP